MKKKYIRPEVDAIKFVSNPLMDTISVPLDNTTGETVDGEDFGAKENKWGVEDFNDFNTWENEKFNNDPWKD